MAMNELTLTDLLINLLACLLACLLAHKHNSRTARIRDLISSPTIQILVASWGEAEEI